MTTKPTVIDATAPAPTSVRKRISSLDMLRGLVMIIMALDHARDFFYFDPTVQGATDLDSTTPTLFITRWVTHFCAPVFVFLSGASAFLYGQKVNSKQQLSWFLFTRGVWLVVLELTVINFGWRFDPRFGYSSLQVFWAIGVSMIALSVLIHLPFRLLLLTGLAIVFGHNLLDVVSVPRENRLLSFAWSLVHQPNTFNLGGGRLLYAHYPFLAWVGVITTGYCFGRLYGREYDAGQRSKWLLRMGLGAVALFVLIRALNVYGDPVGWAVQSSLTYTVMSFFNVEKYPPSLLFLLITLGPALLLLYLVEAKKVPEAGFLVTYGRVPLAYYVLHLYLIHIMALAVLYLRSVDAYSTQRDRFNLPVDFGFSLGWVYVVWITVVVVLYPVCRAYNRYKSTHQAWWLNYL